MKTAIVFSDSHGNKKALMKLQPLMKENDYVLFLGDGVTDINYLDEDVRKKTLFVKGNCDLLSAPTEISTEIEGVKIFMTHGNEYSVKSTPHKLYLKGKELNADVCFYGHTHMAQIEKEDGLYLINPGTLNRYADKLTFCYCVFQDGKFTAVINENFFENE